MSLLFQCSSCDDWWSVACGITALNGLSRLVSNCPFVQRGFRRIIRPSLRACLCQLLTDIPSQTCAAATYRTHLSHDAHFDLPRDHFFIFTPFPQAYTGQSALQLASIHTYLLFFHACSPLLDQPLRLITSAFIPSFFSFFLLEKIGDEAEISLEPKRLQEKEESLEYAMSASQ